MSNQERTFEAGGRIYTLRFTQNALYRLERELGRSIFVALSNLGLVELQAMMWAGLEGARLKRGGWRPAPVATAPTHDQGENTERARPYTLEEAGDIIDELGGIAAAVPIVMDAWRLAMPAPSPGAGTRRPLHAPGATGQGEVSNQAPLPDQGEGKGEGCAAKDRSDADPSREVQQAAEKVSAACSLSLISPRTGGED